MGKVTFMNEKKKEKKISSGVPQSLIDEALNCLEKPDKQKDKEEAEIEAKPATEKPSEDSEQDKEKKLYERLMRVSADYDNYKKRVVKEKREVLKFAAQPLLADLLPLLDNFERAIKHSQNADGSEALIAGVELIYKELQATLQKHGVEKIKALGLPFDPLHHEALSTKFVEGSEEEEVLEIIQEGYLLHGRLLRPAKVVVNQKQNNTEEDNSDPLPTEGEE